MQSYRIHQIYPSLSLTVYEFPSNVVLYTLSGSIRSLPVSSDLFRLCTSNSVETQQRGAGNGSRKAANLGWDDIWESVHGWLLEMGECRREGERTRC